MVNRVGAYAMILKSLVRRFLTDCRGGVAMVVGFSILWSTLDQGKLGITNESLAEAEVNTRLTTICEAIGNEEIKIFTVMFAVSNPTIETLYRECASEPEYFFNSATGDEFEGAFEDIGRKLASLRLAR